MFAGANAWLGTPRSRERQISAGYQGMIVASTAYTLVTGPTERTRAGVDMGVRGFDFEDRGG